MRLRLPGLRPAPSDALARRLQRLRQLLHFASGIPCSNPDFLIAGAQKGGTTSAYAYLVQHPQIVPAIRKEIHYFEDPRSRSLGLRWYRSFFPSKLHLRFSEYRAGLPVLTGEATTYMPYRRIPAWVHAVNPRAKLIFLLRNPVDRALSHYQHVRRSFPEAEPLSFSAAIRSEPERVSRDLKIVEHDEQHDDLNYRIYSYVHSGLYAQHLAHWMEYFPRNQLYITESERFFANPATVLEEISAFLGLEPFRYDCSRSYNVGGHAASVSAEDRAYLAQQFSGDLGRLRLILGPGFGANWTA